MVREKVLLAEELALAASKKQVFVSPPQVEKKSIPQRTNGGLHGR
jgi:hypothetical protein